MLSSIMVIPTYLLLLMAIIFEVFATTMLLKTEQFTQLKPSLIVLIGYFLAFYLLSLSIKSIPIGVAYALWCGIGIVLVALVSWLWNGQKLDIYAILGIALILLGCLVINMFSTSVIH